MKEWVAFTALFLSLFIVSQAYQEGFQRDWKMVAAKVLSVQMYDTESTVGAGTDGAHTSLKSCLRVSYEYFVQEKLFKNFRYSINAMEEACDDRSKLKEIKTPVVNSEIFIWYDKKDPKFAVRVQKFPIAYSIALSIAVFVTLFFIFYFVQLFKNR